jgi:hypothetical protein
LVYGFAIGQLCFHAGDGLAGLLALEEDLDLCVKVGNSICDAYNVVSVVADFCIPLPITYQVLPSAPPWAHRSCFGDR